MTDLGHLLSSVEENVERAHTGSAAPAGVMDGARSAVRRRRTVRHARDGALSVVALVAVGGVVTWGLQPGPTSTDVATTSGPTPEATPAPTPAGEQLPLGAPVPAATPRDVPIADLLTSTGPGWSLAIVSQVRLDAPDVLRPGDGRDVVTLVSPSGERTSLLDVGERTVLNLAAWRPGTTTAVGSVLVEGGPFRSGTIDLLDGTLTPLPFEWEHHPLGLTATGESAWLDVPTPAGVPEAAEAEPGRLAPVAPGVLVALDPEADPVGTAVTSGPTGRLRIVAPDGVARDGGEVTLPLRLHPLSPDGEWLVVAGPDRGLVGVDLRTGEQHPVAGAPTDPACRLAGWADQHAVLTACPAGDGTWRLDAVDVAEDGGATRLATSDVPVRDAWPLGDGRVGLGRVVLPAPCAGTSDPAVLADGTVRSLTDDWSPYDHGTSLGFAGGAVWTHVNGCYPGSGRADPQRDVRVDLATGETTTLAWLDDRRDAAHTVVDEDVWLVTQVRLTHGR